MSETTAVYPATWIVHWPNGPTNACDMHMRQLAGLAAYLGAYVAVTAAPDGSECANCVNAAKAEGR